ncbi:squalene epoxidase-domain-containing protein [Armillaria fumosa]|nr:squalene epoxidase-domain-containing protein [Armillaria fumosa]
MWKTHYDVIIVGAGVVGCTLAHALSTIPREKPLRIALLERSLAEPDRIVGELLQPGGVDSMKNLGLEACFDGIDAVPVKGYCVVDNNKPVHIPYPDGYEGRSFHHGKFIMNLREAAKKAEGVEVVEATVTDLIEANFNKQVIGVRAMRKDGLTTGGEADKESFFADLVVIADGCFSNFRGAVMGDRLCKPITRSHFVGLVLEDAVLPIPNHGTVVLVKDYGPVLLYRIGEHDTRLLVDVKAPIPADLESHISKNILPQLPSSVQNSVRVALKKDRLRRMPNSFLPSVIQGSSMPVAKEGVFLVGDAWNMRHPLTGGGMTVAFNDVVILRDLLTHVKKLDDWRAVRAALRKWHWQRKPVASTVNILSVALYDLFGAEDEELAVLRTGCFKYFERGGECIRGPVSLLSAICPSPVLLFNHFFSVALYSIWVMFTHPRTIQSRAGQKLKSIAPQFDEYPVLVFKSLRVFWTACVVFGPLLWSEIRWWSPDDVKARRRAQIVGFGIPLLAVAVSMIALQS